MKDINSLLKDFIKNNSKLDKYINLNDFISTLPPKLKDGIEYIYKKNGIYFFVLKHNIYLNEFKYLINDIVFLLNYKLNENVSKNQIKFFVSKKKFKKETKKVTLKLEERSNGYFVNLAKDKKIYDKFEKIRKLIKNNLKGKNV